MLLRQKGAADGLATDEQEGVGHWLAAYALVESRSLGRVVVEI
jgi:hypothetical protein